MDDLSQKAVTERITDAVMRRLTGTGDYRTDIPGLTLHRRDEPRSDTCFYKPIMAVTLQGAKRTLIGSQEYRYGEGNCLVAGVDMPNMSHITDASPEKPYLVVSLELDGALTAQLAAQIPSSDSTAGFRGGAAVAPTDPEVLSALLRLILLLDKPGEIRALAPLIIREIHLWLLLGPQGELLKIINTAGTQSNQVLQAINWMRGHFTLPLDVDGLARKVNMAPPTFRKHFKAVTTMSPTQYHKHLRLYEAQRMMLVDEFDVANAGFAVGYESTTQFSREYKRLFGDPPHRNVSGLQ